MIKLFCRHKDKGEIDKYYRYYRYDGDIDYFISAYIVYKCNKCDKQIEKRVLHEYVSVHKLVDIIEQLKKKGYIDENTYKIQQL